MNCVEIQEIVLASLAEAVDADQRRAVERHIAGCAACRAFAEAHRMLDARLAVALPAASLSPNFRSSVRKKIAHSAESAWPDSLPDIAHLAGCGVATAITAWLLPMPAGPVVLAGAAFTALTYFLQTLMRASLESLEGDA